MTTLAAALFCGLLGDTGASDAVVRTAAWGVVGYLVIGIGMNLASRSNAERAVMTPTVAVLCSLCAVVAAS